MEANEDRSESRRRNQAGPVRPGSAGERGRRSGPWRTPAFAVLLLAPFLGEVLSTSTPPLMLLLPWILVLQVALYGSGALICREVAHRFQLGLPGLCLLAAAYGVYEEALIVQTWFDPHYQDLVGVGAYSRVWHTNLLLATHLTAFHVTVSICSSVLLAERLFPARRDMAWAGHRGLAFATAGLLVVVPLTYGDVLRGPVGPRLVAAGIGAGLAGCAFLVPRWAGRSGAQHRERLPTLAPRMLGVIAFICTAAHFVLVYTVPATGLPWPAGLGIALAPIAAGVLVIHRRASGGAYGPQALRVITGVLAFFIVLDIVVGLGGRYDLIAGGLAAALGLWWLGRRQAPDGASCGCPE